MERDRGDQDAACDQLGHHLGGEGPGGARHLGAARLEREDRLVGVERPLGRDVPVADRAAVAVQVLLEGRAELEPGEGQPIAAGEPGEQVGVRAGGQLDSRSGGRRPERRPVVGAELDDPASVASGVESRSSTARPASCAGRAAGRVAEVLTTSRSPARRKLGRSRKRAWTSEPSWRSATSIATSSRPRAACFRRLVRLAQPGRRERGHAGPAADRRPDSARSAASLRSARAGRAGSLPAAAGPRCPRRGTPRCCSSVRMSPGSNA